MPVMIPPHVPIDARVLGFATFCSVATSILFGLAPALTVSRLDLNTSLKEGGAHSLHHQRRFWFRGALAVAQIALSLVLLIGAGLLLRSFLALINVNPGFNPRNVLLADVSLAPLELYGPDAAGTVFPSCVGSHSEDAGSAIRCGNRRKPSGDVSVTFERLGRGGPTGNGCLSRPDVSECRLLQRSTNSSPRRSVLQRWRPRRRAAGGYYQPDTCPHSLSGR